MTSASGINVIKIDTAVAYKAAESRAKYNLKTPDSVQVATALEYGAKYFLQMTSG